jgi:hypothetical protein
MKTILFFLMTLLPLGASALGPQTTCFRLGGESEDLCAVSLSTLIARGEDFDGKNVIIKGFYAYAEKPMLFVSRDAFLMSDTADGVILRIPGSDALAKKLASVDHQYVSIVGRYHADAADVTGYGAGYRSGGVLNEITSVGADGDEPWGYSLPVPPDLKKRSR